MSYPPSTPTRNKRRFQRKPLYSSSSSFSVTFVLYLTALAFLSLPLYLIARLWTPSVYIFRSTVSSSAVARTAVEFLRVLLPYEGGKGLLPLSDRRTQWLSNIDNTLDIVPNHRIQILSRTENPSVRDSSSPLIANVPYIALIRYPSLVPVCTRSELWSNWRVCLDEYTGTLALPSSSSSSPSAYASGSGSDSAPSCIIYSVSLDEYDSADLRYEYTAAEQGCEVHYFNPRHHVLVTRSFSSAAPFPLSRLASLPDNALLYNRTSADPLLRTNPYNPYAAPRTSVPFTAPGTITIHHTLLADTDYTPDELLSQRHASTLREEQLWRKSTLPTLMQRLHHTRLSALKLHIRGLEWSYLPVCLQTPLCYTAINQWHVTYFLDAGRLIHGASGSLDSHHDNLQNNAHSNHLFITTEPSLKELTGWKETLEVFDIEQNPYSSWLNFDTHPYAGKGDAPWVYYTTDELYTGASSGSDSAQPYTAIRQVLASVHAAPGRIPAMYYASYIHRNRDTLIQMQTQNTYTSYTTYIHDQENERYCTEVQKLLKEANIDPALYTIDTSSSIPCAV